MSEEMESMQESNVGSFSSGKVDFSYPLLVMRAIEDCRNKRAVEMKEGYFNDKLTKTGSVVREWIPDARKIFIGSIDSLKALLSPEIKKDTEFKEEDINTKIKNVFEEFAYQKVSLTKEGWEESDFKYIPQIDEEVAIFLPKSRLALEGSNRNNFSFVKGAWNDKINTYYNALIPIYDELFAELINVAHRTGFFKKKALVG